MRRLPSSLLLLLFAAPVLAAPDCPAPTVPFVAEYDVNRNGKTIGAGTVKLERHADGTFLYRIESEAKAGLAALLGARFHERSHWMVHDDRPRPLAFERGQKVAFRERHYEAHFDWNDHEARGNSRGEPWHLGVLPDDTLDRVLVNLAVLADLRCGAETLSYTVLEKGELDEWRFDRQGEETVRVPGGTYRAVKVAKRHSSPDRKSLSWHAPALNWLAVRIEHVDGDDGDSFSMELRRYAPGVSLRNE